MEADRAIPTIESQLQFFHKAECFHANEKTTRKHLTCTPEMDRTTLARIAEQELMYLQTLSPKEKNVEVILKFPIFVNDELLLRFYIDL
jgi:hypothetical protein